MDIKEVEYAGERIDSDQIVKGYYFKAPLTAENFTADSFSSGITRHCISDANGVVYEVKPETVAIIIVSETENYSLN